MTASDAGGIALRRAQPADLPMLEVWARRAAPAASPPYIAVTFSAFEKSAARGELLVVSDAGEEVGYVVVARLWSNRLRGEVAVIDDVALADSVDRDLVLLEARRLASRLGAAQLLVRGDDGSLTAVTEG